MAKICAILILFACTATQLTSCNENNNFVQSNNEFSLNIFNEILKSAEKNKNVVISPYSIQTAATLAFIGAKGDTAQELFKGLKLPSSEHQIVGELYKNSIESHMIENSTLKIANKIYVANGFSIAPNFHEIAVNSFHSDTENIDFFKTQEAVKIINKWIEDKTNGKILDLIKEEMISPDILLIIANAIHFKAAWQTEFDKLSTRIGDFIRQPGEIVQVELMRTKANLKYQYLPELGIKVADYPFKGTDLSMFFIAPNTNDKSLDEVEAKLNDLILKENIFNKPTNLKAANFVLPKFKIDYQQSLKETFTKLGMGGIFGRGADFSNLLTTKQPLAVSDIIHAASVEVTEEGAEAAAVTVFTFYSRSGIPSISTFELNQSFLYFIKGKNGEIYFMGRYTGTD